VRAEDALDRHAERPRRVARTDLGHDLREGFLELGEALLGQGGERTDRRLLEEGAAEEVLELEEDDLEDEV